MTVTPYTLHIRMTSDWHIGTGTGRHAGIDRLVARDADQLPYIPASTVRNIWRDAAERLALGLDNGTPGGWQDLVRQLFGSQPAGPDKTDETEPVRSCVFVGDARLTDGIASFAAHRDIRDALTFIKPGVGIDERTGTARDDFLRFEEIAMAGLTLSAPVTFRKPAQDVDAVKWFLVGAACLVERIGAKRRRGLGACEVRLLDTGNNGDFTKLRQSAATKLREHTDNKKPAPIVVDRTLAEPMPKSHSGPMTWQQVPIEIRHLSPLIIADEVQGNVITTLDHIPGGYLLPIVSNAARKAGIANVGERIAIGDLRVLPATIDVAGTRGLPIPQSWSALKDQDLEVPFTVHNVLLIDDPQSGPQLKAVRKGYVSAKGGDAAWQPSLKTSLRTHNVIEDEFQTPTEDVGGVFTYEAIEPGAVFRSVVQLLGNDAEVKALKEELGKLSAIHLGRAKQAGYGEARLELKGPDRDVVCTPRRGELLVWLETDAVLPGDDLASVADLDSLAKAVAGVLDSTAKMDAIFDLENSRANLRARRVQSWQAQWGLPRPSLTVLQAGSVARLKLRTDQTPEALKHLATVGIGERRAEGFGAVRLNDPLVTGTPQVTKASPQERDAIRSHPSTDPMDNSKILALLSERAWKRRILARAEAVMSDPSERKTYLNFDALGGTPRMSQLGALRALLTGLEPKASNSIVMWINRKMKWSGQGERPVPEGWLKQIDEIASPGETVWTILGLVKNADTPPVEPGASPDVKRGKLWSFAVANTLLIAMRHHKRASEQPAKVPGAVAKPTQTAGGPI